MSITEKDWQEEQQRVNLVEAEITRRISLLQQQADIHKEDVVQIRKHFWDDVSVNLEDLNEVVETYASMKQQAEVLSQRESIYRHAQKQLKTLTKLQQSPYFGRIDFAEEGQRQAEEIYLGIASLLDENDEQFLIYDWRAPVSSLYYDFSPGPAEYNTPSGTFPGTMELKRQYIIRDGVIKSMFDTGVTIGDELLQQVLGKHSDSQMKTIVATIQREQNQIIRNEKNALLVVQGAAGSGKTSAALQRVAYLLYRYREFLQAENIVLFSPNPMFNSYVSTVLPELGEENMQQTTFQQYLDVRIGDTFQIEDPFIQMEYTLKEMASPSYSARMKGISFKASTFFNEMINHYVKYLGRQKMIFKDITFQGNTIISSKSIEEYFYGLDSSFPIPNRMELLTEWMLIELRSISRLEKSKEWVEQEMQFLEKHEYMKAYNHLKKKKRFSGRTFDDFDQEHEVLASYIINKHFKPIRTIIKQLKFVDVPAIYVQLFTESVQNFAPDIDLPDEWDRICRFTIAKIEHGELYYEDTTPYLYLKELIEGFHINNTIKHVFIDEAQDYSPFQFTFIKRLFPRSKMTVLGDLNQAIYSHSQENNGLKTIYSLFGEEQAETIRLTKSYRSTRQIVEFTREFVPNGSSIEPFNREGHKPTVTGVKTRHELHENIIARIDSLLKEGHQTVAVICKTAQESKEAYEHLKNKIKIKLIKKETTTFESGIVVIPSYLAKGVEFDAVIIYDGSAEQYGRENERTLFYTVCTRAMHELFIYYLGEASPFIAEASPETYTLSL